MRIVGFVPVPIGIAPGFTRDPAPATRRLAKIRCVAVLIGTNPILPGESRWKVSIDKICFGGGRNRDKMAGAALKCARCCSRSGLLPVDEVIGTYGLIVVPIVRVVYRS